MLRKIKMSILNAILKKNPIIDFKMELLVRFLTTLNCKLFLQKDPFYMF